MMAKKRLVPLAQNAVGVSGQNPLDLPGVRELRRAADALASTADYHRAILIDRFGHKRYIFNTLGMAAHLAADGARLVWPDGMEQIECNGAKLGDYLYARVQEGQDLPEAVILDGKKYYL
jgi:hypothetical protein